ncbi:hypothetical protein MTR67_052650 [Solanum verrucosum]|uniref:Uncharacterized protein n=1 Tax=Solanum verrucosum TaxID=315347 RepID=A0AAF0V7A3_SOLVR|nr:hypothetical protein MTR67_052650 [Solanum verrucosum]
MARFCEHSRHAMTIVPDKAARVYRFVRQLTFSVSSNVFTKARERASFQSTVSTANEAGLMVLEKFVEPKRARSSGQFSRASSRDRGLTTDSAELKIGNQSKRDLDAENLNLHHEKM